MATPKKLFTFFLLSCLSAVIHAQASVIKADLQTIDSDTKSLTSAVNAYDGSVGKCLTVQQACDRIDNDIKKLTTDANNSPVCSSADTQSIIAYMNSPLEPDLRACANAMIAKKSTINNSTCKSNVCDCLKRLCADISACGNALVFKASSDQKSNAQSIANKLVSDCQSARTALGCDGSDGGTGLPPAPY